MQGPSGAARPALEDARAWYADVGVDVDEAIAKVNSLPISVHAWQADDVAGFERQASDGPGGGIMATGNHPGRARNVQEVREDLELALSLVPGTNRVNLHAMYGEFGGKHVDRDEIGPEHFHGWMDWAASRGIGLDMNSTLFAHPRASQGFTLASKDKATREFWIRHVQRCREIGEAMGARQGYPCVHNLWIPDGMKDATIDRAGHRQRLLESLDEIHGTGRDPGRLIDAVEGKLFGLGSESFVAGSHEFYCGYAITRGLHLTLDTGHFHPTESVADKVSALAPFVRGFVFHVSRGIRWDSDHVVIATDDLLDLARELAWTGVLAKSHVALDYFDASINRVAAYVIGIRATRLAFLQAWLTPWNLLRELEECGDWYKRLALLDELRHAPSGAVWDHLCATAGVPVGTSWFGAVDAHHARVARERR